MRVIDSIISCLRLHRRPIQLRFEACFGSVWVANEGEPSHPMLECLYIYYAIKNISVVLKHGRQKMTPQHRRGARSQVKSLAITFSTSSFPYCWAPVARS